MSVLYIALAHHPVLNKAGETVTTSISNLDIHDIARVAETYGVKAYYIVHADLRQQELLNNIRNFWQDQGLPYNPQRSQALARIRPSDSIDVDKRDNNAGRKASAHRYHDSAEAARPDILWTSENSHPK